MKKFLSFLDTNILRYSIAFAILFIPLYPKLPSIGISHVWVYIRLEDFVILLVVIIWLIQLLRKKVSLPLPEGYSLIAYWIIGLITLIYCLLFLASHIPNFFPLVAALEYVRRIEYMILFFAAYSSVKKQKDVILYLSSLGIALTLVTAYGFGQKFYEILWTMFPTFFNKYQFCFPAYLTGNEQFAKGIPLCLNNLSRIASTFGGNYDLSSYLVLFIPLFIALFITVKKLKIRVLLALLVIFSLELLNFTSSRTAYIAYLLGIMAMLIIWKKKLWIIPVLIISIGVLFLFSTTTLQRFEKTIQQVQIVQVRSGSPQQEQEIQNIIKKNQQNQANSQPQSPPPGTVTVGNGAQNAFNTSSSSATSQVLTKQELQSLQENISTVSGTFLLSKAYALDVSLTTRFQAEWPRDWQAFLSSPIFGVGYSSLTLASDNDYLRALGETGLTGALSFFFIFVIFGIFMKDVLKSIKDPVTRALLFGLAGGTIGLLINAILIDVFESSKVAESFWIFLGIGLGAAKLYYKEPIQYKKSLKEFFTSNAMICIYIFLLIVMAYSNSISNFFVADDFIWLQQAATASISDLPKYFIYSQGFLYSPLDKVVSYFLYEIFSFQQQGFHIFILSLHFITAIGVYFLAKKLSQNKIIGLLTAVLFAIHPAHTENVFWFSTLSDDLSSLFIMYAMLAFIKYREQKSIFAYIVAIIFTALAFTSYGIAVVIPFLLLALDIFILKPKKNQRLYLSYLPFVLLLILYLIMTFVSHASFGGYHLSRILPNIFGNLFGYTGIFISGLSFLPLYNFLRDGLRAEWIYFSIVILLFIGYVYWMFTLYQEKVKKVLHHKEGQLLLFCIVFIIISLAPFLPLGYIASQYLYLASVGYSLALVVCLQLLLANWIKTPRYALYGLFVVCLILGNIYFVGDMQEQLQWQKSGEITQNTLLYFRRNYSAFTPQTNLYFVNTPVEQNNTWIFSYGLSDGLWFIYREHMPQVHQVRTLQDALSAVNNSNGDNYIFTFDNKGNISQVK